MNVQMRPQSASAAIEAQGVDRKDDLSRIIEDEILDGILAPGERLDERALAERFGVSRTPVREALNRLSAGGLIEIRRNAGIFVASMTLAKVLELYEAVSEIETVVTRLATRRATPEQRRQILALANEFEEWARQDDIDLFAAKNVAFHAYIYAAGHNRYLEQQAVLARRRIWAFRRMHFRVPGRMQASTREHIALAEAIASGDESTVLNVMRSHGKLRDQEFPDFLMILSHHLSDPDAQIHT
jgi:DNA-binding GntR family transcriptional regulator